MTPQAVAQTIQFIIAPAVLVTTCALLLNGLLLRYAAVNDRLRLMASEQLEILRMLQSRHPTSTDGLDPLTAERLSQIATQMPELLGRHRLIRNAILIEYSAVLIFIGSMIMTAVATVIGADWIGSVVLMVFLVGTIVLLAGAILTAIEVSRSHHALEYEVRQIMSLGDDSLRSR